MKKLIVIILITFSFSALPRPLLFDGDWWKGNHNPNGKTLGLTYKPAFLFQKIFVGYYNPFVRASTLLIPLTDYMTIEQTVTYYKQNGDWNNVLQGHNIYFHLPLYKLWE
jgi:hypothetical protein